MLQLPTYSAEKCPLMANIISDDTESDDDDNEFVHLTAAQHAQQFVPTTST